MMKRFDSVSLKLDED